MQLILLRLIPNQSNYTIQHLQLERHNLPQSIGRTWYFCSPTPSWIAPCPRSGSRLEANRCARQADVLKTLAALPYPMTKWSGMSLIAEKTVQRCKQKQSLTVCEWPLPSISTPKWQSLSFSFHKGFLVGFINLVALTNHSSPELQAVLRNRISNFKGIFLKSKSCVHIPLEDNILLQLLQILNRKSRVKILCMWSAMM